MLDRIKKDLHETEEWSLTKMNAFEKMKELKLLFFFKELD